MVSSVPYSERTAQQNTRSVAVYLPDHKRLRNYTRTLTREGKRGAVTMGDVIKLALDALDRERGQS